MKGFIEVTATSVCYDDRPKLININCIESVAGNTIRTSVRDSEGVPTIIYCRESYGEIKAKISEATR